MPLANLIAAPAASSTIPTRIDSHDICMAADGCFALVDAADYHEMSEYQWRLMTRTTSGKYVHRLAPPVTLSWKLINCSFARLRAASASSRGQHELRSLVNLSQRWRQPHAAKVPSGCHPQPTVITPGRPKPVPSSAKTRQQTMRTAWAKHLPHLMLSDQDHHLLWKLPCSAELIDVALGKTAAAAAFGSNKQYDARGVINYAGSIARRLSGNSPLPKRPYGGSTI